MPTKAEVEHIQKIVTPTAVARTLGKQVMGRPYIVHPWIAYIEREILAMLQRPGLEIMVISVPPQEGKTSYCGMWLPAWYLGQNPSHQVLFICYNEEYAGTWGVRTRNIIEHYGPDLFGVGLSRASQNAVNWKTDGDFGGLLSAGIMGGLTGNPGHLILIDDVIKGMEEALSPTVKRKHWDEWDGAIQARFQDDTKVLLTATAWAEDDLRGRIIERAKEPDYTGPPVRHINIKARAEPTYEEEQTLSEEQLEEWTDFLGRRRGEFLKGQHSAKFWAMKVPPAIDNYVWNAEYQGTPSFGEDGMFPKGKWVYYDPSRPSELPRFVAKRRVWDLAATDGAGDWTVGYLMAKTEDDEFYVLDLQRFRKGADEVLATIKATAMIDGFLVPIRIEKERSGAGETNVEFYKLELMGWDVDGVRADGSKESRAWTYSSYQRQRKVYLPEGEAWLEAFMDEHSKMMGDGRRPRHDDQIDCGAYAVLDMLTAGDVEVMDNDEAASPDEDAAIDGLLDDYEMERYDEGPQEGIRSRLAAMANP